jgi:hypothetical protein
MKKMTRLQRQRAMIKLQKQFEAVIMAAPDGLKNEEIGYSILAAASNQGVVR